MRADNSKHLQLAWDRAKKLAIRANITNMAARAYLTTQPEEKKALLDKSKILGYPARTINSMVKEAQSYKEPNSRPKFRTGRAWTIETTESCATPRPSKGDNTQHPRAGAPITRRKAQKHTKNSTTSVGFAAHTQHLITLKTLVDALGGFENLQEYISTLKTILK